MSGFCTAGAKLGAPDTGLLSYAEMVDTVRGVGVTVVCVWVGCVGVWGVWWWQAALLLTMGRHCNTSAVQPKIMWVISHGTHLMEGQLPPHVPADELSAS